MGRRTSPLLLLALGAVLAAAGPAADRAAPLFKQLHDAQDGRAAMQVEARIVAFWHSEVTPSVQLLVEHAQKSMAQQDRSVAVKDLDAALDLQPELGDLWRLHAEARFAAGDDAGAYADIAQALSREPRCFPALADLSRFAESRGDFTRALQAWRKFLEVDPHAEDGQRRMQALTEKVEGEPL